MSKLVISGMWLFLVGMSQPSDVTVHKTHFSVFAL